jgi:hypothetical protein
MVATKTPPEGRGPALVVLAERGKGEGMPYWADYPFDKARKPGSELSVSPKFAASNDAAIVSQEPPSVTTSEWMGDLIACLSDACGTGRPSVSRVREICMHGLKGGFRSSGSQEHRA